MIDVSIPATPTEVGHYGIAGDSPGVVVSGKLIFVADGSGGVAILRHVAPDPVIGMIDNGSPFKDYTESYDRLTNLGYRVSVLPASSGIGTFRRYDVVDLPIDWAETDPWPDGYPVIEAHAADYHTYVQEGVSILLTSQIRLDNPATRQRPVCFPIRSRFLISTQQVIGHRSL